MVYPVQYYIAEGNQSRDKAVTLLQDWFACSLGGQAFMWECPAGV